MPPERLHGTQKATQYGAACPQQAFSPVPGLNLATANPKIAEDCQYYEGKRCLPSLIHIIAGLTVNVLKPTSRPRVQAGLPVVVVSATVSYQDQPALTDAPVHSRRWVSFVYLENGSDHLAS